MSSMSWTTASCSNSFNGVSWNAVHLGPFKPLATLGTLAPWKRSFAEQAVYRQQLLDGNEEILTEAGRVQPQRVSVVTVPFNSCCNIIL